MAYLGIDVAKWNGTINWSKVMADGIKFAILKVTKKSNAVEDSFVKNYTGVTSVGIPVGVYRYVYAKNASEAAAEANAIVKILKNRKIKMGIWLDMEDASIKKLGKTTLFAIIKAEYEIFKKAGFWTGVYCNQDWYRSVLPVDNIDSLSIPFWIAKFGSDNGKMGTKPTVSSNHTLWGWQYTSKGKVSGVSGYVDLDVTYAKIGSSYPEKGDTGDAVKLMQKRLTLCGYSLTQDGIWGNKTDTAVRAYQYKAGLTVDGIYGPKTRIKLIQDACKITAIGIATYMVSKHWHYRSSKYVAKTTYAETKKEPNPGCTCAHYVSWILEMVGLLKTGEIVSHTDKNAGVGVKSVKNISALIDCTVTYPNKPIATYKENLNVGDIIVSDSSIGIWVGDNTVYTARTGVTVDEKTGEYKTLKIKGSGYEWRHNILAVIRAK